MTKRILSILLAVLMLAGAMMSTTVTAADESPYKDVKVKRWSYADIMYVTENGLMNGTGEGIFAPAETMTRAMVVTVLYRLQGSPEVKFSTKFTDVKKNAWYADAVIWAAENDIVNGVGDYKFAPMETITREQLATIIMRYAPMEFIITEEQADITGYADYKRVHDYARESLSWANAVGLITGVTESTLEPRMGATREQFAAILRRFKEYDSYRYSLAYNAPVYGQNYVKPEYPLVTDADIYVAVDGNDANPGTIDKPIATFAKAKEMVRELKNTKTDGIKVAFKAGNYGALDNLVFDWQDSGTAECPITYCAYGDGDVVFMNGIAFSSDDFTSISEEEKAMFPEKFADGVYKMSLAGKFDTFTNRNVVFSETGVCHEARYPNKKADGTDDFFKDFSTRVEEEGKTEAEYDKILLQSLLGNIADKFKSYEGLKLTGFIRTGWLVDTFTVKEYDRETNIITFDFTAPGSFDNGYQLYHFPLAFEDRMDDTIFFSNLPEFLDSQSEYWFDSKTSTMYMYKPEGEYTIGSGGTFMSVNGGANYISFVGLEFNTTTATAIFSDGNNLTFEGCTIANVAGDQAIECRGVRDFTAINCELYNFVCDGIHIIGQDQTSTLTPDNNLIKNCYFHDFSLPQYWAHGVLITRCIGAVIEDCLFVNGAHAAIRFDGSIDTVIQRNVFDNMMMTTADYGALYTFREVTRRGNTIRYNLFTNIRSAGGQYAIYLDGSYGVEVYGNLFYNAGSHNIVFNDGRDNDVHDNISISNDFLGDFLMYNAGPYDLLRDPGKQEDYDALVNNWHDKPEEGEAGYELWRDRWPIIYDYNFDRESVGDFNSFFSTINYVKRNKLIGSNDDFGEIYELFGVRENNEEFALDENPYFADPTHGDYSIVSGQGGFEPQYVFDFSAVGRK